jgi:hypothetical protein
MTEGQTFQKHNPFQVKFYHDVIQNAKKKFIMAQVPILISPVIWLTDPYIQSQEMMIWLSNSLH